MGCERYEPHLTAYLDNELTREARSMMERHVGECRACREVLEELKATRSVMQQWKAAEVGEEFLEGMKQRIRQERRRGSRAQIETKTELREPRHSRTVVTVGGPTVGVGARRWWLKAALAASVLIGAGLLVVREVSREDRGERPMSAAAARKMVSETVEVGRLSEVAVATEGIVAAQVRKARPRPAGVIGAETVQLMLETARVPAQRRYIEMLLGAGGEKMLAARTGLRERAAWEAQAWLETGWMTGAYGDEAVKGTGEMTARTEAALSEGLQAERAGKYEEAIEAYGKVRGGTHERTVALVRKGGLLIRLGRFKEAGDALGEADRIGAGDELTRSVTGRLKRRVDIARETSGRVEELKRSLAERPGETKGWRELADLELGCGNYAGASEALWKLAEQVQGDERAIARFRAAWCDKNRGEYEKALGEMEKLREQEGLPRDVRMLCMFESADILYRCGRYAQSIDAHRVLIGYPGELDDASRALLILRVGYVQLYDLTDEGAARETLTKLTEARYSRTPAGQVAAMMLQSL